VISEYFRDSNVIDSHNQARQYELALEKRWVVKDAYFRLDTTIIGMTVTDCWRAYKHGMPHDSKKKDITMKDFAARMAYDCIYNCHSDIPGSTNGYLATEEDDSSIDPDAPTRTVVGGRQSDVSTVTAPTTSTSVMAEHVFQKNHELEYPKEAKPRPIRRGCRQCGKQIHWRCSHRRCESFVWYKCSHGWVCGVFYCPQHYHVHYHNVIHDINGSV
jgi:hypothetical protein